MEGKRRGFLGNLCFFCRAVEFSVRSRHLALRDLASIVAYFDSCCDNLTPRSLVVDKTFTNFLVCSVMIVDPFTGVKMF